MTYRNKNISVGEIVTQLPDAKKLFDAYNIDYCCGGNRLLSHVLKEKQIGEEKIYTELERIKTKRKSVLDNHKRFDELSHTDLSTYIEDRHHSYLRETLPAISELMGIVLSAHGKKHRELFEAYNIFGRLKTELEQHLLKEENLLFPGFDKEEENRNEIDELSTEIIKEHEAAGAHLEKLRELTDDYIVPEDACDSFRKLYSMLLELEDDLHQHIHLENNILLKEYDKR